MQPVMNKEELLSKLESKNPDADIALVGKAYDFAEKAHKDQKRKSGEPYIIHPVATANTLIEMEMDDATIAAGLLHDVPEDTPTTLIDIRKEFGP